MYMFNGDYNFFEYKYNIIGYEGQDYGGIAQNVYLGVSLVLLIVSIMIFRKLSKEKIHRLIRVVSVFMVLFYLFKTTWESLYDIRIQGEFNTGLLPFDSCSIIMLAGIISGFAKGKIKEYADAWIVTGGIVGGIAAMLYLNAFKYYPFWSFGAFYSMTWHFLMVFMGITLIASKYISMEFKTVIKGFIFHLFISLFVIPIDFIFDFDFMLYKYLGGVPFFEGVASKLAESGMQFLNPILMIILYFIAFNIIYVFVFLIQKIKNVICSKIFKSSLIEEK